MDKVNFFFDGWWPILRILVVGTLGYATLVALLRSTHKRTLARLNAFDFVITVTIGAVFGRVLTARSVPLAEAITAFALLIALQFAVSSLQLRSARFARLVSAPPTLLYYRGQALHAAMREQRVTEQDLWTAIREHGAGSLDAVEAVVLEPDGRFAVIKKSSAGDGSALRDVHGFSSGRSA